MQKSKMAVYSTYLGALLPGTMVLFLMGAVGGGGVDIELAPESCSALCKLSFLSLLILRVTDGFGKSEFVSESCRRDMNCSLSTSISR